MSLEYSSMVEGLPRMQKPWVHSPALQDSEGCGGIGRSIYLIQHDYNNKEKSSECDRLCVSCDSILEGLQEMRISK